jgi:hypothetical protein
MTKQCNYTRQRHKTVSSVLQSWHKTVTLQNSTTVELKPGQDRLNRAGRTGQAEQVMQNRSCRTGKTELDRQNGTGGTGRPEINRQNRIVRTGHAEKDRQNKTGRKVPSDGTGRAGQSEKDRQNETGRRTGRTE